MGVALIVGYHLTSRVAYAAGVGVALVREDRAGAFTRRYGVQRGFRRFRRFAAALMANDAVSFVALCWVTRRPVPWTPPPPALLALGLALIVCGVATKLWAARRLGHDAYYWHNFFDPNDSLTPDPPGPYRYLDNPMYTVGYLQTYGLALVLGSTVGLLVSVFDQAAILTFHRLVEKPHFDRLAARARRASAAAATPP